MLACARNVEMRDCLGILKMSGAGDGNRTHVACLEGRNSTIELRPRLARIIREHSCLVNSPPCIVRAA